MPTSNDEQVEHKPIEHEHAIRTNIDIKEDVIFIHLLYTTNTNIIYYTKCYKLFLSHIITTLSKI